jgi:hypothetical protein
MSGVLLLPEYTSEALEGVTEPLERFGDSCPPSPGRGEVRLAAPRAEGADLNGAHSFSNFVRYIYENQKLPPAEIVASLNEQGMEWLVERLEPAEPNPPS